MKKLLYTILILLIVVPSVAYGATNAGIIDWLYTRTKDLLYLNTNIEQVLIGGTSTTTDDSILEIQNGLTADNATTTDSMDIGKLSIGSNAYEFPTTDGSANNVLSTDGSGLLSWTAQSGGSLSDWLTSDDETYIYPSTTKGILINSSSTIQGNFRVDGSATTTGSFYIAGTASTTELYSRNMYLSDTSSNSEGILYSGGYRFLHSYGANNIFLGKNSGNFTLTNSANIGIGNYTLDALTSGGSNTVVGFNSLTALTTGANNSALGSSVLNRLQSGTGNVAVGGGALQFINPGDNNVAIGTYAGLGEDGVSTFSNSVLIGRDAGKLLTTGTNNMAIGFQAGNSLTTGSSNLLIGYDVDVPSSGTSNYMNIGDLLYGDLSSNYFGVNTSTPGGTFGENFTVTGDSYFDGSATTTGSFYITDDLTVVDDFQMNNNLITEHPSLYFLDVQTDTGSSTIFRIKAPQNGGLHPSEEATLTLMNDLDGDNSGVNEEFVDVYNEHYSDSLTWGMRQIYTGTGECKPAQFGHWNGSQAKDDGNKMTLQCSGTAYFGQGTALPASTPAELTAQLHIASSSASYMLIVEDGTPGSDTTPFSIDGNGFVGIGDKDPTTRLHVQGNSSDTVWANHPTDVSVSLQNSDATDDNWFNILNRSSDDTVSAGITFQNYDHTNHYASINFETRGASGYNRTATFRDNAFGINTTTPGGTYGEALTVTGGLYVEGSATTTGSIYITDDLTVASVIASDTFDDGGSGNITFNGNMKLGAGANFYGANTAIYGGWDASDNLNLQSTSNGTKGNINLGSGDLIIDDTTGIVTIAQDLIISGTATSTLAGNIEISGNASTSAMFIQGDGLIRWGNGMCMGEDTATTTPNLTIQQCSDF